MSTFDFLPGWKTYMIGLGMIAAAVAPFLMSGELDKVDWQLVTEGFAVLTFRKAISRDA